MTMLGLEENLSPKKARTPAETMLGLAVGALATVVIGLLLYANKDWIVELAKKIF